MHYKLRNKCADEIRSIKTKPYKIVLLVVVDVFFVDSFCSAIKRRNFKDILTIF